MYHSHKDYVTICLFKRALHTETHLSPDKTILEQNVFPFCSEVTAKVIGK